MTPNKKKKNKLFKRENSNLSYQKVSTNSKLNEALIKAEVAVLIKVNYRLFLLNIVYYYSIKNV